MQENGKNLKSFDITILTIALVALILLLDFVFLNYFRPNTVDTWTGKGGYDDNWSDAANWTSGVPADNYSLVFKPVNGAYISNNDLSGLALRKISFEGRGNIQNTITLKGNSFSLSHGILVNTGQQVDIEVELTINLTGSQLLNDVSGMFNVSENAGTSFNLGNNVLTVNAPADPDLSLNSLSGKGTLIITNNTVVYMQNASPNYSGTTDIASGGYLDILIPGSSSGINSLGSSYINVARGGELDVIFYGTAGTLSNAMTLDGNGIGKWFGVIFSEGGNFTYSVLNLTGKITLSRRYPVGRVYYLGATRRRHWPSRY